MTTRFWVFLLLCTLITAPRTVAAQSPVDSLIQVFGRSTVDSLKWIALFQISQYYAKSDLDSALAWAQHGLEFAQQHAPSLVPRSLNNVGLQYMNRGNFDRAMDIYLKAIESARQYGCRPCIATTTGNIGIIFWNKKEYDKAENYFREAIVQTEALKDTVGQARYLNNLGLVQMDRSRLNEAEKTFRAALHLLEQADTLCLQPTIYSNLGNAAYARGNYPQALEFYRLSSDAATEMNDHAAAFFGLNNSGWVQLAMKNYDEAIRLFTESRRLAEQVKNEKHVEAAIGALAETYKAKGDFVNAFHYLEMYLQVHDTLATRLNNKAVLELETRYRTQQKEAELAKKQVQIQQQRLLLFGSLLVVLVLLGLFQFFRNRQRNKQKETALALRLEHAEAEKLRELDRAKSAFFANISHELRTPLTLILGPVQQWLSEAPHPEPLHFPVPGKGLHLIRRNANRLLELVNQLLDLAKLESGRMRLNVARGDLGQTLRVMANSFESMAEQGNVEFDIVTPADSRLAWFDRDKLEKIAANLLSNAFKNTPPDGKVFFHASVQDDLLLMEVGDTGRGIPPDALDKIFERFYQLDQEGGKQVGTGIGLALVRELISLHHGNISIHSSVGQGSVFRAAIPVGWAAFSAEERSEAPIPWVAESLHLPGNEATGEAAAVEAPGAGQDLPLCLIVEDNLELQGFIREQLSGIFHTLVAPNGRVGLEIAIQHIPDLIISDVMMPEMDGNAFCTAVKTDERTSHIPVILLTARAGQESKIAGLETGADEYLTKPFDTQELVARAKNLIKQRENLRKRFSRTLVLQPQDIELTSTDERFLERIRAALNANLGNEQYSVEDLAAAAGMSRSQLHRKLTALLDQPPVEFIRHFRLHRAKEMLEAGTGSISEIGYAVGFNSPAYFSKVFKDAFGMTPGEASRK